MKFIKENWKTILLWLLLSIYIVLYSFLFEIQVKSFIAFGSFCVLRLAFNQTWKAKKLWQRILLIGFIYSVIIQIVPNENVTIFGGVLVAFIFDYILFSMNVGCEKIEDYEKIKQDKKNIHKMNEEDLRNYLKENGLSARQIDLVVLKIIYQIKGDRLEDKLYEKGYPCSHTTIVRDIKEIKKLLKISKI